MPLVDENSLDEIRSSDKLPSPSGVALEILRLTQDENASCDKLGRVLVRDPALAGQILKYANSAQIRPNQEVTTVADAVVRLGTITVRQLALGFSLLASARGGPCEAFDYVSFWTGSLASGVGARVLCRYLPGVVPDEAFTCGLLGQIGRLCLASVHPDDYTLVLRQWSDGPTERLLALEREIFSVDHNAIAAALFRDWGLPESFQDAVRYQEDPARVQQLPAEQQTLPRLLLLAGQLARICAAAPPARDPYVRELLVRGSALGLGEQTVSEGCAAALEEWQQLGEALDLIIEDVPPIQELVARARQNLGEITGEAQVEADPCADRLRILVVDDSAVDRRILEKKLHEQGHSVTTASDGEEGLRASLRTSPQVIITDWMMPRMDGLELCASLRCSEATSRTYIIVMTAQEESERLVEAFEAGADDYVVKPVNHRILLARLRAAQRLIGLQERVERDREEIRRNAARLAVVNRKLDQAARQDQLTELPNRRAAMEQLELAWDNGDRHGDSLVCMMVDIDRFKKVNDTYGHHAGDVVLRATAQAMGRTMRSGDTVARFGGEEFIVICPRAEMATAVQLGDRIRRAVADNQIDSPEFRGGVTVSVGVSWRTPAVASVTELLKLADEALYAAKQAGRNKVCINDPDAED
ncbi:MAG: HDOD domain-containing protein [Candidatus Krumholzibacteriia bacterium]